MKKFYYLYKITNILNYKIYIGIHSTDNLNDDYMGSGQALIRAQKKYGLHNFNKEILEYFDNPKSMQEAEASIVNEKFVKDKNTYNLILGGGNLNYGPRNESVKKTFSEAQKKYQASRTKEDKSKSMSVMGSKFHWSQERKDSWRNKLSKANKGNMRVKEANKNIWANMSREDKLIRNKKISEAKKAEYALLSPSDKILLTSKATLAASRRIICPYCNKDANTGNYSRWHGDNCKMKSKL